jgi:hypothetical protein
MLCYVSQCLAPCSYPSFAYLSCFCIGFFWHLEIFVACIGSLVSTCVMGFWFLFVALGLGFGVLH